MTRKCRNCGDVRPETEGKERVRWQDNVTVWECNTCLKGMPGLGTKKVEEP